MPFARFIATAPHLFGIKYSDWENFTFPLLYFGLVGTFQWFLIGWGVASALAAACGVRPKNI